MATTALVSEILIIGLEAEAWLTVLVLAVFGSSWADVGALKGWEALVTILVLATAYVLGILVDRLADSSLRPWTRGKDRPGFALERLVVLHRSVGIGPFLEYQRSRVRIARGTLFNVIPAGVSVAALIASSSTVDRRWLLAVPVVTLALFALTLFATRRINKAYEKRLVQSYRIVTTSGTPPNA
ncbi:MAG: hypothetical protein QOH95_353 [Gaiellaceae bacterium]|nr:hypothetical protein [Gaiellaceae bacterium]